ncbi:hypothetical protein HAX54_037096 [Datura stramonium]|uniref:Uncharacterized protein n=1 Tax=Datura stramonium TaxID=4076 RepID=A0ABS8SH45_DATST|nr:hypothetical protein [Datura stramonium]
MFFFLFLEPLGLRPTFSFFISISPLPLTKPTALGNSPFSPTFLFLFLEPFGLPSLFFFFIRIPCPLPSITLTVAEIPTFSSTLLLLFLEPFGLPFSSNPWSSPFFELTTLALAATFSKKGTAILLTIQIPLILKLRI